MDPKTKAIVTGAAQGIGSAIVENFVDKGYQVLAIDKNWLVQPQQENIILVTADISEKNFWDKDFPDLLTSFRPNILINNAGCQFQSSFLETTPEILEKTWLTNLAAPMFLSQATVRFWIEHQIPGIIVNISSIHEIIPSNIPSYSTTKAALAMLTKEIALVAAPYGIRVLGIAPGSVDTPLNAKYLDTPEKRSKAERSIPLGRLCQPAEVAHLIYIVIENCPYLTGTTINLDGGLSLKKNQI
jgi:NAD(P)-dependent dehydrogenase (short-subunit alcohol dehydrogenase family)